MVFDKTGSNGLSVYNSATDIQNTAFINNNYAMQFNAMSFATTLTNVTINNEGSGGGYGLFYSGSSTAGLHLDHCDILRQEFSGVIIEDAPLSVSCSNIKYNDLEVEPVGQQAIELRYNATFIADPSLVSDAGRSDLSGYAHAIFSDYGEDLLINKAQLNLSTNNFWYQNYSLHGVLTRDYTPDPYAFTPGLLANDNYWLNGKQPYQSDYYFEFYYRNSAYNLRKFDDPGNAIVRADSYLTSFPGVNELCPSEGSGGGDLENNQPIK